MAQSERQKQLKIGFVGLGDIGEPMARRVALAGFATTLWARREASLAPFEDVEHDRAVTLADLGRACDVAEICVFGQDDVSEVVLGEEGILTGMRAGGVIVVHSTVPSDYVLDLARHCERKAVTVLDAPISGFRQRAIDGQLTVMVGGPVEAYRTVLPVLESFGNQVEHVGSLGQGLAIKALNQALLLANLASSAIALDVGRQLGLEPGRTERVLRSASGGSFAMELLAGRILRDPRFVQLATSIADKDLVVFEELCRSAGISGGELHALAARANETMARLIERA